MPSRFPPNKLATSHSLSRQSRPTRLALFASALSPPNSMRSDGVAGQEPLHASPQWQGTGFLRVPDGLCLRMSGFVLAFVRETVRHSHDGFRRWSRVMSVVCCNRFKGGTRPSTFPSTARLSADARRPHTARPTARAHGAGVTYAQLVSTACISNPIRSNSRRGGSTHPAGEHEEPGPTLKLKSQPRATVLLRCS